MNFKYIYRNKIIELIQLSLNKAPFCKFYRKICNQFDREHCFLESIPCLKEFRQSKKFEAKRENTHCIFPLKTFFN